MATKMIEMYTVICDRCGVDAFDDADMCCWGSKGLAREMADADDWKEINGDDYCFSCVELDVETDEWIPKLTEQTEALNK